jgi:hypothetical protein
MNRHTTVRRTNLLIGLTILSLTVSACWGSSGDESWSAPDPPDGWASGLEVGYVPDGYSFVRNEGHETATFHVFQTGDGDQVSIGRQISPEPYPIPGEQVDRDGREFTLVETSNETRVLEEMPRDIRVEVVSQSLDADTLLRVAESVSYDPNRDSQA